MQRFTADCQSNTRGRFSCLDKENITDNRTVPMSCTYDNMGNMLTMTTGITEENTVGQTTAYQYDSRNRLVKTTDPMGYLVEYEYNDVDQLTMTIDKCGTMIQNYYDAAGRLIRSKTGLENTYHTYFTGELPLSVTRGNETTTYTYNAKGQVTKEEVSGTDSVVKTYQYNNRGDVARIQVQRNNGEMYDQTFGYNPMGQLTTTGDFMGGGILVRYTYDGVGNIATATWRNDIVTTYTYNTANAISSVKNKLGENVVSEYEYTYYLDGNRAKEIDNVEYGTEYSYDGAGRLVQENRIQRFVLEDGTLEIPFRYTTYTYDSFGNRATMQNTGGASPIQTTYTYDANNRLTMDVTVEGDNSEATTYSYNSNGNLLSKTVLDTSGSTTTNYSYDFYNRLTGVSQGNNLSASYTYDAFNRRTQKTVNGTTTSYVWDGDNLIYEVDGDDNEQRYQYAHGLIGMDNGDNLYTYLKNAHGDVVQMTNSAGAIAEDYTYDAWGNQEDATHTVANPFRYSGEYFDEESGLIYLRNRYYDSSVGRFITEDPARDGLNWYVYCENNPVMFVDPSGLTYVIAWSYGKADLDPYITSQGDVNWTKFTAENSFARAAATRKQELIDMGVPESQIDIQRIDNEADMKSTWEMWAGYNIIEGMDIYSHGYSDGISVAGGGGEFLSNTTKLKWGSMLRSVKVNGTTKGVVTSPYAVFHGCNTANGTFAQDFANTQGVTTYAQTGNASFSRNPIWHIPIKDGATGGSVYLYHFNWNNIKNTDGSGKVFYAQ